MIVASALMNVAEAPIHYPEATSNSPEGMIKFTEALSNIPEASINVADGRGIVRFRGLDFGAGGGGSDGLMEISAPLLFVS